MAKEVDEGERGSGEGVEREQMDERVILTALTRGGRGGGGGGGGWGKALRPKSANDLVLLRIRRNYICRPYPARLNSRSTKCFEGRHIAPIQV